MPTVPARVVAIGWFVFSHRSTAAAPRLEAVFRFARTVDC